MLDHVEKVLVDGDIIAYKAAFIGNDYDTKDSACECADKILQTIIKDLMCDDVEIYLTSSIREENYRHKIAVTHVYKGNRKQEKPTYLKDVRRYLAKEFHATPCRGIEADDALGIALTNYNKHNIKAVVASIDKDLLIIPGTHYNINKKTILNCDGVGKIWLDKKRKLNGYGFKFFCSQMVTGDVVDNIKGIKGKGPVYAYDLLKDINDVKKMWKAVYKLYTKHESVSRFIENAKLLWIQQEENQIWPHVNGKKLPMPKPNTEANSKKK